MGQGVASAQGRGVAHDGRSYWAKLSANPGHFGSAPVRLLITGIPGSGKTTIGDYFRDRRGYVHVDMEALIQSAPPGTSWAAILTKLEEQHREHADVALTWGFMPGQDNGVVRELKRTGYRLIWLDGNRESARRAFLNRGTVSEELLDRQMARIATLDLNSFGPVVIDPFDESGSFRTPEAIADDILRAP